MSATFLQVFVHIVWSTFQRRPMLTDDVEKVVHAAIQDECRALKCPPVAIGGTADHVHVLVSLSASVSLATLVQQAKGVSAHLLTHRLAPAASFRWQRGYSAFSLRKTELDAVRQYVLHQKQRHHARALVSDWEIIDDIPGRPNSRSSR